LRNRFGVELGAIQPRTDHVPWRGVAAPISG
jgi:hypothetical protein